jgi:2-isopropylmalate synthase
MERISIFDTTLRDGEQAAGGSLNVKEKIEVAKQLENLGVNVIEAGFPISSKGDFESVKAIGKAIRNLSVCGLARANIKDIDACWDALKGAADPRLHIFISASPVQMKYQLNKTPEQVLDYAVKAVAHAHKYLSNIEFSPMDATRADKEFLYKLIEAVIDKGASVINIPDTVGYSVPAEYGKLIKDLRKNVSNIDKAVISVHCHNDMGLAVANSIEAISNGARQVECTVNGIGERAGNASLEEIVMILKTRKDFFKKYETSINSELIYPTSRMVSEMTGFPIPVNKAIVGANAFRHESGIHQDGVIKNSSTFEIINPRNVGVPSSSLVMGKLSGSHALKERLAELGYSLSETDFQGVFNAFKEIADRKKEVEDKDIEELVAEYQRNLNYSYILKRIQVSCGDKGLPTASIILQSPDGTEYANAEIGSGPIDAVYKAIDNIVKVPNTLTEFSVNSITHGIDAIGSVIVRIENNNTVYTGRGADVDIIVASAKAYLNALNRLIASNKTVTDEK